MTNNESQAQAVSSPKERRERMRDEMIAAILTASRSVMRERGVAGLSLREVARRVKLSAPSIYAYFVSKAALYDALYASSIRLYAGYKERGERQSNSFWENVRAWFTTYMQFAQENPDLYQLAFERPVPGFSPSETSMAESRNLLIHLEAVLKDAVDRGEIQPGVSLSQARDLLLAIGHGLTSQHMANEPDLPIGQGRYGSLIPAAIALFERAWGPAKGPDRVTKTRRKGGSSTGATGGDTRQRSS